MFSSLKLRIVLVLLLTGALIPLAAVGWRDLFEKYLEFSEPVVQFTPFRGINSSLTTLEISVSDPSSGLSEIHISEKQGTKITELYNLSDLDGKDLIGAVEKNFSIDFLGKDSGYQQGMGEIIVEAKDKSIWKNSIISSASFPVDFNPPSIEIISKNEKLTKGGTGIVIYRISDEDILDSGVIVGKYIFKGYPIKGILPENTDNNLYISIYTFPIKLEDTAKIKVYADDKAGNTSNTFLQLSLSEHESKYIEKDLSISYLRDNVSLLYELNKKKIEEYEKLQDNLIALKNDSNNVINGFLEQFKSSYTVLRELDNLQILSFLSGYRFDAYWKTSFLRQLGKIDYPYGANLQYKFENKKVIDIISEGYSITLNDEEKDVFAVEEGIVIFSENIGTYGRCVALDHGLGVVTIYYNLDSISVKPGEIVKAGEVVGEASRRNLNIKNQNSQNRNYYFEVRVGGYPVDPSEWWDKTWYDQTINSQLRKLK